MKFKFLICGLLCISTSSFANNAHDVLAYTHGYQVANTLPEEFRQAQYFDQLQQGFQDAINRKASRYTSDDIVNAEHQFEMKQTAQKRAQADENRQKGHAFLAENAKKAGVITTKSGLQYKIIKQGTGKKPTAKSTVFMHYEILTIDGTVFDTTLNNDQPSEVNLRDVFPGIAEGLQYLRAGGEIELYVPASVNGYYADILSGVALIYKIKLLKVK